MTIGQPQERTAGRARRIVVGIDGSEASDQALAWAAAEAQMTGASLEVHTAYGPGYEFVTREDVRQWMQGLVDVALARVKSLAPEVPVTGATHEDAPSKALVEASEGADLLVVGSRGHGGFAGLLLGSVSLHCVMHAHCSVVVVRPHQP